MKKTITRRTRVRKPTGREGDNATRAKLSEAEVVVILRILANDFMTREQIARVYRVHPTTIYMIQTGATWKYLHRPSALYVDGKAVHYA